MWEQRELGCSTQWSKFIEQIVMKNVQRNVKLKKGLLAGNFHWFPHTSFIASDGTICLFYPQSELSRVFLWLCGGLRFAGKTKKCTQTEGLGHIDEDRKIEKLRKLCWTFIEKHYNILMHSLTCCKQTWHGFVRTLALLLQQEAVINLLEI